MDFSGMSQSGGSLFRTNSLVKDVPDLVNYKAILKEIENHQKES
jgi:hypothetical protein